MALGKPPSTTDKMGSGRRQSQSCSGRNPLEEQSVRLRSKSILKYPCAESCEVPSFPVMKYGENMTFFRVPNAEFENANQNKNKNKTKTNQPTKQPSNQPTNKPTSRNKDQVAGKEKTKKPGKEKAAHSDSKAAPPPPPPPPPQPVTQPIPYLGRDEHNPPMQSLTDYIRVPEKVPNTPIVEVDFVDAEFQDADHMTKVYNKLLSDIHMEVEQAHKPSTNKKAKKKLFKKSEPALPSRWPEKDAADSFRVFSHSTNMENSPLEEALSEMADAYDVVAAMKDELAKNVTHNFLIPLKSFVENDFKTLEQHSKQVYQASHQLRKAKVSGTAKGEVTELKRNFSEERTKTLNMFQFVLSSDYSQISKLTDLAECWLTFFREGFRVFDGVIKSFEAKTNKIKPMRHKRLCLVPPRAPLDEAAAPSSKKFMGKGPHDALFASTMPPRHQCQCPKDQLMFLPAMAPLRSFGQPPSTPGQQMPDAPPEAPRMMAEPIVRGPPPVEAAHDGDCGCHCDCPELEPGFPRWWKKEEKRKEIEKKQEEAKIPPPPPKERVQLKCQGPNHVLHGPCTCESDTDLREKEMEAGAEEHQDFFLYRGAREMQTPYGFVRADPGDDFPGQVGDVVHLIHKDPYNSTYVVKLADGSERQTTVPMQFLDVMVDTDNIGAACQRLPPGV